MIRLTDEQWERIRDHFPEESIGGGRPGRKPTPTRCVLEAVLWILNTGAQWHMLPQSYPNYKTVHRRFQTWCRGEVLRRVLTDVANELRDRGALNEEVLHRRNLRYGQGGGRASKCSGLSLRTFPAAWYRCSPIMFKRCGCMESVSVIL
jgi:transposase